MITNSHLEQREEQQRRQLERQRNRDWKRLKAAQAGTPHFPLVLQYLSLGVLSFFLFVIVISLLFASPEAAGTISLAGFGYATFVALRRIGFPYQVRQAAKRFHTWDNPEIIGTLCQMLTWADREICGYARTGLTRLLPQVSVGEQSLLSGYHRDILCRMLNFHTARQYPEFVVAILEMLERLENFDAIPLVVRLTEIGTSTPSTRYVQNVAIQCLNNLQTAKVRQSHRATLLRPTSQTASDYLLTPAFAPSETKPDELLRPTENS